MNGRPLVVEYADSSPEEFVSDEEQLKVLINTFVWSNATAAMPLGKAGELACKIFTAFVEARNEFGN